MDFLCLIKIGSVCRNHELVIFDVPDDGCVPSRTATGAISFGDGGKGLSLNDVAIGRKVLSHFLLDDIDFIDIEHSLAISCDGETKDIESNSQDLGEFWQGFSFTVEYNAIAMSKRWSRVDEDRLKIHFTNGCGTLYLRLLVDLKEKECRKISIPLQGESRSLLANVGTETKIWCRTIARYEMVCIQYVVLDIFSELPSHFLASNTDFVVRQI